jgi:hypothetical protein
MSDLPCRYQHRNHFYGVFRCDEPSGYVWQGYIKGCGWARRAATEEDAHRITKETIDRICKELDCGDD